MIAEDGAINADEELKGNISCAIADCLKLYSFWNGKKEMYAPENIELLLSEGVVGYEKINHFNGIKQSKYLANLKEDEEELKIIFNNS